MLRDTHRPQNADTFCLGDHVGHLLQRFYRQAAAFRRKLQRERFQALAILFKSIHPGVDKVSFRQPVIDQIARDRREPNEIGARLHV